MLNGSYFSKLSPIKNRNHLCINTTNPVSHFCTFVAIFGYKSTTCVELLSKIPADQLTFCDYLSLVNKHRYFSIYFLISSQCFGIGLNEVRCFSLVSKPSFDKLNWKVFLNSSHECTLGIWTKFIVDYLNVCLIVHQK